MIVDCCDRELLKSLINNRNSAIDYFDEENHLSTENVEEPTAKTVVAGFELDPQT